MADRPYHHGDLRRALVEAGLAILEEQGLAGLTLRACAGRAGVSHAAPKNHFDGLAGLLTAICAEGFRRHEAATRAAMNPALPRAEQLAGVLAAYVAFAEANPALYRLMFSMNGVDREAPEFEAASGRSFAVLVEICAGLDWPGADLTPSNANTWVMVWSFLHGFADLKLNGLFKPCEVVGGYDPKVLECWAGFGYRDGGRDPAAPPTPAS